MRFISAALRARRNSRRVSFFRRLFSADYRRAVAAEAAGDYVTAARAYALAGDRAKVGEMLVERAQRAPTPEAKLADLRTAVGWCEGDSDEAIAARRRLAQGFEEWADKAALVSEADRDVMREAARLFASVGDARRAADCYERTGDSLLALQQLERAGDVDKLEGLFNKEEQKRKNENRQHEALEDYRAAYRIGQRARAREALLRGIESDPADRLGLRRFLTELDERRLGRAVQLYDGTEHRRFVVGDRLVIGRDPQCELVLADAGVSRKHARLTWDAAGLKLAELGSRNGTRWRGLGIDGNVTIDGQGELQCGPEAKLALEPDATTTTTTAPATTLQLTVRSGSQRGLVVLFSTAPIAIGAGLTVRLEPSGWLALDAGGSARLNDLPIKGPFEPLAGDRLDLPQGTYEIAR